MGVVVGKITSYERPYDVHFGRMDVQNGRPKVAEKTYIGHNYWYVYCTSFGRLRLTSILRHFRTSMIDVKSTSHMDVLDT